MPLPMMPPQGMPPAAPATGNAMNLGAPMSSPTPPPLFDPLASIKDKLAMGSKKSLPGVGFKKPVGKVAKKAVSSVRALKRKMGKKGGK